MKIKQLAQDKALLPASLTAEERSLRAGFIVIRTRRIRQATPDPDDIPDADIPGLKIRLATEMGMVKVTLQVILNLVEADEQADKIYKLQDVDARMKIVYVGRKFITSTLKKFRKTQVQFICWWLMADDFSLVSNIADLHLLVDRKLRITERMLYDVGRIDNRSWTKKTIAANINGDWKDGWNRMFEYPRIKQDIFLTHCTPNANTHCTKPALKDWHVKGSVNLSLIKTARVNAVANPFWAQQADQYLFFFKSPSINNPAEAIEKLFTPSKDYKARNLLFCDHVIHILHMEALLFSKKKRNPDINWLKNFINNNGSRMCIYFMDSDTEFLAGPKDTTYFQYMQVKISELQIGDQLIVFNHPAYDKATVGGVWRLENALVVAVYPKLYLQGHGTHPLTFGDMKSIVVGLFNGEIQKLREKVKAHIKANNPATEIDFANDGRLARLVRRVHPAFSTYQTNSQKADWWLRWPHDSLKDDAAIAADPDKKKIAWEIHKVDYDSIFGFFPLWEPVLNKNKEPIKKAGKISLIQEVTVTPEMIAGWTWTLPVKVDDREKTWVLRPKK